MKIRITIHCDNAAFDGDDCGREVRDVLRDVSCVFDGDAAMVARETNGYVLRDTNGNRCGEVKVTP